ncbi:MAG: acyltransferase, partial [Candidatus Hydrogenedentota bacterium]
MQNQNTSFLGILKALAIFWIVLFHCWILSFELNLPALCSFYAGDDSFSLPLREFLKWFNIMGGDTGVSFFLICSGFGLTFSQMKRAKFSARDFYGRRVRRIYLPYILAHLVALLFVNPSARSFVLSMTGLIVLVPGEEGGILPPFWFIGMIIQLYLVFPFLYVLLNKTRPLHFLLYCFSISLFLRWYL